MPYSANPYEAPADMIAAQASEDARSAFITRTYLHLVGAILAFVGLEAILLHLPMTPKLVESMISGQYSWLIVLGAFMVVSWIANSWAQSAVSPGMQYAGLGLYVVAEAIIFVPLLYIAERVAPHAIPAAAISTVALFAALTGVVFITKKDFSFLRSILFFAGIAAFGLIVVSIVFQFALGAIFIYAMIALACGYILYYTSNVLHHYRLDQHVAASLALFAAIALLFWYILQLFLSRE